MALKGNVFTGPLFVLFDALLDLDHAANVNDFVLKTAMKYGERILSNPDVQSHEKYGKFYLGTALGVPDYYRARPWTKLHLYDRRNASDDRLHELAVEMGQRVNGQIICATFEVMETFLREVGANVFFQLRNKPREDDIRMPFKKNEFHSRQPKWRDEKFRPLQGTPDYFAAYMRTMYRNGLSQLLTQLATGLPFFRECSHNGPILESMRGYYQSVEFFRHHMVHQNGRYDPDDLSKLGEQEQEILKNMTAKSTLFRQDMLLPSRNATQDVIGHFSGLAFLLYEGLSSDFRMQAEWPDPRPTVKQPDYS